MDVAELVVDAGGESASPLMLRFAKAALRSLDSRRMVTTELLILSREDLASPAPFSHSEACWWLFRWAIGSIAFIRSVPVLGLHIKMHLIS
jgi:hypothetical protein